MARIVRHYRGARPDLPRRERLPRPGDGALRRGDRARPRRTRRARRCFERVAASAIACDADRHEPSARPRTSRIVDGPLAARSLRFGAPHRPRHGPADDVQPRRRVRHRPPRARGRRAGARRHRHLRSALRDRHDRELRPHDRVDGADRAAPRRAATRAACARSPGSRSSWSARSRSSSASSRSPSARAIIARASSARRARSPSSATRYLRVILGRRFSIFFLLQLTAIQRALGSAKTPVALLVLLQRPEPLPRGARSSTARATRRRCSRGGRRSRARSTSRGMELVGAAWATVIARTITLVPGRRGSSCAASTCSAARARTRPDRAVLGEICRIAWPSSTQLVVRMLAMLVTHSLVARAFTTADDQTRHHRARHRLPPRDDGPLRRDGLGQRRADLRRPEPRRRADAARASGAAGSPRSTTSR